MVTMDGEDGEADGVVGVFVVDLAEFFAEVFYMYVCVCVGELRREGRRG